MNILVSFVYLDNYNKHGVPARYTMLDSGAFSAWKTGKTIDIEALKNEMRNDRWNELVSLDVVGDSEKSVAQYDELRVEFPSAIPVFHYGEPWAALEHYCEHAPKVGLSCRFGEPTKKSYQWLDQCFARHWPHGFHSFGFVSERALLEYPFASADSSTWVRNPAAFGIWISYRCQLSAKGMKSLAAQVHHYLDFQERVRVRWQKTNFATLGKSAKNLSSGQKR